MNSVDDDRTTTPSQTFRSVRTTFSAAIDCAIVPSNEAVALISKVLDESEDAGSTSVLLFGLHGGGELREEARPHHLDNQLVSKWERVLRRIERAAVTTAVLADGICSRFALDLLAVADRRVGTKRLVIQSFKFTRDVWPGMALYRFSRQLGEARARRLYLDNRDISAAAAMNLNLIDEVVDNVPDGLEQIDHFLAEAPRNFAVCRRLMQESATATFEEALGSHLAACDRFLRKADNHAY